MPPAWFGLPVGVAIGLLGVRLALGPHLLERSPAPGASAASTSAIRLTFNQPMDPTSVSSRLHLRPSLEGEWTWTDRTLVFRPAQPWPTGTTVEVRLDPGARSLGGLTTWFGSGWEFSIRAPRLAYLWPAGGAADLYARPLSSEDPDRLTSTAGGVTDFALGGGGTQVVYTAERGEGESEIRLLDLEGLHDRLLFACPTGDRCSSPALSPDGILLAFVRVTSSPTSGALSPVERSRVWLMEIDSGMLEAVSPEGNTARAPFWSPRGWLAYLDSTQAAIVLADVSTPGVVATKGSAPSVLGERGGWSPDGRYLVYPDLRFPRDDGSEAERAPALEAHLYRWEVATGELLDLSTGRGESVDDTAPSFSPRGDWIVFSRRVLAAGEWTPGRQLWRMRPDGSDAEALTRAAFINHGAPAFSPTGEMLAYLRYNVEAPLEPAEVWWFDLEERQDSLAVHGGYSPTWIP